VTPKGQTRDPIIFETPRKRERGRKWGRRRGREREREGGRKIA